MSFQPSFPTDPTPRPASAKTVPALSMAQPYAKLFADGVLLVDDRTWSRSERGWIALHASFSFDPAYAAWARAHLDPSLPHSGFDAGGLVGALFLSEILPPGHSRSGIPLERRAHFGGAGDPSGAFFGLRGWVFSAAFKAPFTPARGARGLFRTPEPEWWSSLPDL